MRKWLLVGLGLLCAVLAGAVFVVRLTADREGPEIIFQTDAESVYTEGQEEDELLKGVTARDKKDGDVTESLRVESVYPAEDKKEAVVVYTAKDSSNNVTKEKRKIKYQSSGTDSEKNNLQQPDKKEQEEGQGENPVSDPAQETASVSQSEEEKAKKAAEESIAALAPEAPKLRLKAYYVKAAKGSTFDRLSYVTEITDDKDPSNELWRRIQISGEPNMQVPGTYELVYSVTDKEGNPSNQAKMTVVVE